MQCSTSIYIHYIVGLGLLLFLQIRIFVCQLSCTKATWRWCLCKATGKRGISNVWTVHFTSHLQSCSPQGLWQDKKRVEWLKVFIFLPYSSAILCRPIYFHKYLLTHFICQSVSALVHIPDTFPLSILLHIINPCLYVLIHEWINRFVGTRVIQWHWFLWMDFWFLL